MGKGKTVVCKKCGLTKEHAAAGLCFACYRQLERAISSDPEAKAEQAASRDSGILIKAQNKMVKALCSQWALIKVYEEFGVASELLEEDSTLIPTLTKLFAPLLDKISSTLRPQKLEDPNPGPPPQPHVQTVLGNHYRVPPFEGEKTVPETLHVMVRKSPQAKPKTLRAKVQKMTRRSA